MASRQELSAPHSASLPPGDLTRNLQALWGPLISRYTEPLLELRVPAEQAAAESAVKLPGQFSLLSKLCIACGGFCEEVLGDLSHNRSKEIIGSHFCPCCSSPNVCVSLAMHEYQLKETVLREG